MNGSNLNDSVATENSDAEDDGWLTDDEEDVEPDSKSISETLPNETLKMKHYPPRIQDLWPGNSVAVEV